MKKMFKQMLALMLALVVALSFTPVNAQAAGPKVTISRSGKVKAVYYKGGKAKKASFTLTSTKKDKLLEDRKTGMLYDAYDVVVTIKRPKLSKSDIIKTVKESKKKGGHVNDFCLIVVDENGNKVTDGGLNGGSLDTQSSSSSKTLKAKEGRKNYYIWNWRKTAVYKYQVVVPHGQKNVYVGFAGLKNGQIKKSKEDKLSDGNITYFSAGFGSKKKGFIIAGPVAD